MPQNASLFREYSAKYLCGMHLIYEKANVDNASCYRLLRKAVQEIAELSWFAFYHEALSYRKLKQVVEDFDEKTKQFGNETEMFSIYDDNYRLE